MPSGSIEWPARNCEPPAAAIVGARKSPVRRRTAVAPRIPLVAGAAVVASCRRNCREELEVGQRGGRISRKAALLAPKCRKQKHIQSRSASSPAANWQRRRQKPQEKQKKKKVTRNEIGKLRKHKFLPKAACSAPGEQRQIAPTTRCSQTSGRLLGASLKLRPQRHGESLAPSARIARGARTRLRAFKNGRAQSL